MQSFSRPHNTQSGPHHPHNVGQKILSDSFIGLEVALSSMALSLRKPLLSARPALPATRRVAKIVSCQSQQDEHIHKAIALPLASMVAAALLAGSFCPEEALAARSGGRSGGSSFSARKSYSAPAASRASM